MPYIAINTSVKLSDSQKEKIKTELGRLISIIPTKSEAGLLINFSDSATIYKAGENVPGAFIDIRLLHKADFEARKKFTEETFDLLIRELGIKKEHIYLSFLEFDDFGVGGTLKT